MADRLYLSLWFPNFRLPALAPTIVSVLKQFSGAGTPLRVRAAAAYPISWNEAPFYQRIYEEDEVKESAQEQAVAEATEILHDDFAYEFELNWDLWVPETVGGLDPVWKQEPATVYVVGFGPHFDEGAYEENGQVRVDLGLNRSLLLEDGE